MKAAFLLLLLTFSTCTLAQHISSQFPGALVIDLDLKNGIVKDEAPVPFGVRLLFKTEVPDAVDYTPLNNLYAFYKEGRCPAIPGDKVSRDYIPIGSWERPSSTLAGQTNTAEIISGIQPKDFFLANRNYCLLVRRFSDPHASDDKQQAVSVRTQSQFSDYVKLDFGAGYSFLPKALFGTLAAHLYVVPVNDNIDLAEHFNFGRQFLMRTSLFAGIAPVMFSSDTKQDIKPATGVGNVVFGVGFRAPFYYPNKKRSFFDFNNGLVLAKDSRLNFMQSIRLNVGWILFKQADSSPLIVRDHPKIAPYISLTYDASLTALVAPIALLLGAK